MPRRLLPPFSLMSPSISLRLCAQNPTRAAILPPSRHFLAAILRGKLSKSFAPTCEKPPRAGSPLPTMTALPAMQPEQPREDRLGQTDVPHPGAARLGLGAHQRRSPHL